MDIINYKVLFLGDIMPGGVLPYQEKYIDEELLTYLRQFDLRVGTLECGVGESLPFDEVKLADDMSVVVSRNCDLIRLKEMGINVVTLANNHAFDLGLKGLENVFIQLNMLGIKYCGAGHNIEEAKKPAVIKYKEKDIAFIGCMINPSWVRMYHVATETDYGVYQVSIDTLEKDISDAKQKYDKVIVLPHWGEEHKYTQRGKMKEYAKRILAAGADCIIGSHPHVINPVVSWNGKKCYFSLGNFLFSDMCMQVPRPMYYPASKEEFLSLKRVWMYPYRVEEPVLAVWKPKNRIGMMVEMEIGDKIRSRYRLTCLTADNVIRHYHSFLVRLRMRFWALLMHLPNYNFINRVYNNHRNFLRKAVDKLPAFNVPVNNIN